MCYEIANEIDPNLLALCERVVMNAYQKSVNFYFFCVEISYLHLPYATIV